MGKKYVMFVDERGFNKETTNSFSVMGVIFEYDYCINSKNGQCELRKKLNEYKEDIFGNNYFNMSIDNVVLNENIYRSIDETIIDEFVNELPILFKELRFTIISSTVKYDSSKIENSYSLAVRKLLKKFYSFIMKKNGESGGIIIESKGKNGNYNKLQEFFDIYNEKNVRVSATNNIQEKINTFIVCEKDNIMYGSGIEILNIANNIFFRVTNGYREIDDKLILYINYDKRNKIFNEIKQKTYVPIEAESLNNQLQDIYYINAEGLNANKELKTLKEQLRLKEVRIQEKRKRS